MQQFFKPSQHSMLQITMIRGSPQRLHRLLKFVNRDYPLLDLLMPAVELLCDLRLIGYSMVPDIHFSKTIP
jgi:predicted PilT family ATPase